MRTDLEVALSTRHEQPVSIFQLLARGHRTVVMMYVKYPLSLCNIEDLLAERGPDVSSRPSGSGGTGLARHSPPRSAKEASRICAAILSGAGIWMRRSRSSTASSAISGARSIMKEALEAVGDVNARRRLHCRGPRFESPKLHQCFQWVSFSTRKHRHTLRHETGDSVLPGSRHRQF